ncbi:MAG: nucleotidyltransferase domain-containing protein [Nanoarchaeota archaeon]
MVKKLLAQIKSKLEEKYGDDFTGLVLYGSYAKGKQHKYSDLDILVLFKFKVPINMVQRNKLVGDLFDDLEQEHRIAINPIISSDCQIGKTFLTIEIADYAKILVDKNNAITFLFNEIKNDYKEGRLKRIIKKGVNMIQIVENAV